MMTEEQFKRLDERLEQIANIVGLLVAVNSVEMWKQPIGIQNETSAILATAMESVEDLEDESDVSKD